MSTTFLGSWNICFWSTKSCLSRCGKISYELPYFFGHPQLVRQMTCCCWWKKLCNSWHIIYIHVLYIWNPITHERFSNAGFSSINSQDYSHWRITVLPYSWDPRFVYLEVTWEGVAEQLVGTMDANGGTLLNLFCGNWSWEVIEACILGYHHFRKRWIQGTYERVLSEVSAQQFLTLLD